VALRHRESAPRGVARIASASLAHCMAFAASRRSAIAAAANSGIARKKLHRRAIARHAGVYRAGVAHRAWLAMAATQRAGSGIVAYHSAAAAST